MTTSSTKDELVVRQRLVTPEMLDAASKAYSEGVRSTEIGPMLKALRAALRIRTLLQSSKLGEAT